MSDRTLVAGVDSSTQSCKVVIVDAETGAVVRSGRASHPAGTEVDPQAWWDALQDAIAEAGGLDDVAAISVGGQQHGMVVLDAGGRVIRPALLWNDTRSAQAARDLAAEVPDIVERTGSVPVASFTSTKLRWLRDNEPENAARVAAVALPHDWLTWRLRGFGPENPRLDTLTTDRSDASGTGYWNPTLNDYDYELLTIALGHEAIVPRVVAPSESAGAVGNLVFGPGAGDNAGAALGLGAVAGDVVVSIGTSGTVFAVTETPSRDASGTVAGFADASGLYLPLVATLNAARVLDSISALLGVTHNELGELALRAQPGAEGLVLQPYFEGERTPNLPDATATLFGMTLASTSRENLARAAIEGLLCGLAAGLDALRANGVTASRILLVGGAAQNPAVSTIAAQVFDVPVVVPQPGEYVAAGAAVQSAWALTGQRPAWVVPVSAEPAVDYRPIIREQYAAV
ncbi:xylulokinase [Microbacteriaceae bacterium SG_E_30_P1]|uniref:Xylulose kinase n=1 Tax=Antiquaquibacter oligotrophicus TaxID=2880260 RepID=A0ABT6KPJ8_9MICO|nr:xylulokinase [Antiquaquibacter oligotrophicus]MDH6181910.1 xylulokinase [Antiquaquibacter oligotrophicus]UDF12418.1 xylulokinase [Antiquaquibacter oligotrophicus]